MSLRRSSALVSTVLVCWNWKCALLSATIRTSVMLAAMTRKAPHGRLSIALVEMAYVTLTSGLYAGLQQHALRLRPRLFGNFVIVAAVPALAQLLDWMAHRAMGAPLPPRALLSVCILAAISSLFHLHVMRNGAFLTGGSGRSLLDDFRRVPALLAGFLLRPLSLFAEPTPGAAESEASL